MTGLVERYPHGSSQTRLGRVDGDGPVLFQLSAHVDIVVVVVAIEAVSLLEVAHVVAPNPLVVTVRVSTRKYVQRAH